MSDSEQPTTLKDEVIKALRTVYDPEIPVNIFDLGLIYDIDINESKHVALTMTLTSPACPVAGTLPGDVELKVQAVEGVGSVTVDVVWDPPWGQHMMSEAAQIELGLM